MISVRWQFKMKNPLKIRAIFAGIYDWNRDEARVVAKCIRLMEMTVDTDDFSVDSCLVVANELKIIEEELMMVYGKETRLQVRGTDFKDYFPCNTKKAVIKALKKIWGMIQAGRVKQGLRRPRGQWMNIPPGKYARARWGKSSEPGVENRKVSDVFEFQEFKAEVPTCFRVGDAILEGPEVTIGEPSSPCPCICSAKLSEHALVLSLTHEEKSVFGSIRYVDDGICVTAYNPASAESLELEDAVFKKIKAAYSGITVTDEGTCNGGEKALHFLEYAIGVSAQGDALRWHHHNKNAESVMSGNKQKFLKLRPWGSGTYNRQLLRVVRSRLCDMLKMTKAVEGQVDGMRGDGDIVRDMIVTTMEFLTELHVCLQYPMRALIRLLVSMAAQSGLWSDVLCVVKQIAWKYEKEKIEAAEIREAFESVRIERILYE